MYFKKVIIGFFTLAFLYANVFATDQLETSGGLTGAPDWVLQNNGPYSTVGSAVIKNGDFDLARAEAVDMARADMIKQIMILIGQVSSQAKETIEKMINNSRPVALWINNDGSKVFALVKLPMGSIAEIRKTMKKEKIDYYTVEHFLAKTNQKNEW